MGRIAVKAWMAGVLALWASGAGAQDVPCGLCAKAIVTNSTLATCFLDRFSELSGQASGAIAVDLSTCPPSRGVVEALPTPNSAQLAAPDTQFLLSRTQLDCLKGQLEDPGIVLDPQARIDLVESCG